jgi:hypothetical protein
VRHLRCGAPAAADDGANEGPDTAFGKTSVPGIKSTGHVKQAVYDGRTALGIVELTGGAFVAVDVIGHLIGTFATLKAAVASLGGRPR